MNNPFETIDARLSNIENLLLDIKQTSNTIGSQPETDQLLTIKQAGEFLNLSVPTLYDKVHNAEIPVCKQGNRLYFSKQDLLLWVKSGRKKTFAETAIEAELYVNGKIKKGQIPQTGVQTR